MCAGISTVGTGRAPFEARHIAGAVWVDLDHHQLAGAGQPHTEGRHPFPTPTAFAAAMGSLGIANDSTVVAYAGTIMLAAAGDWTLQITVEPTQDQAVVLNAVVPIPGSD